MITFIIPIKKRKLKENFLENFKIFSDERQIFFAVEKGCELNLQTTENERAKVFFFNEGTREEDMIESLISKVDGQTLVIIRDGEKDIDFNKIKESVIKQREGNDIVVIKNSKKSNFLKTFFSKLIKSLVYKLFGFKFFDGEITVETFSNKAINILKTNGTGNLSKIDRWVGANTAHVDGDVEKKCFKDKNLNKIKLECLLFGLGFILLFVGGILLGLLVNLSWLAVFALIIGNFIIFSLLLYNLLRCYVYIKVGDLTSSKMAIIDVREI